MSVYTNKHVRPYQEEYGKLSWHERDMMSYINDLKDKRMKDNPNGYFKIVEVLNSDIIHHECCGDKLKGTYKSYKIIECKNLEHYPKEDAKIVMSAAFRNQRDNLWIKRDLMLQHFKESFN